VARPATPDPAGRATASRSRQDEGLSRQGAVSGDPRGSSRVSHEIDAEVRRPSKGSVMAELTVAVVVAALTAVLLVVVRGLERL